MQSQDSIASSYVRAQKRIKKIKDFYLHLSSYLLINLIIFISSSRDQGLLDSLQDLENYITAIFWGIGILAHWVRVFGTNFFFGRNWEDQKIKKLLEKDKTNTWE